MPQGIMGGGEKDCSACACQICAAKMTQLSVFESSFCVSVFDVVKMHLMPHQLKSVAPLATDHPADRSLFCTELAAVPRMSNIMIKSYLKNTLAPKPI